MSKNIKNILVAGAGGFIGGHLVDSLIAESCSVIVIDDESAAENSTFHWNL